MSKPHITRRWFPKPGVFAWAVTNEIPASSWTGGTDIEDRRLWREAYFYVNQLNNKESHHELQPRV